VKPFGVVGFDAQAHCGYFYRTVVSGADADVQKPADQQAAPRFDCASRTRSA
jgi:hypothetical protein